MDTISFAAASVNYEGILLAFIALLVSWNNWRTAQINKRGKVEAVHREKTAQGVEEIRTLVNGDRKTLEAQLKELQDKAAQFELDREDLRRSVVLSDARQAKQLQDAIELNKKILSAK